jgi:hypothetical protein
LAKAYAEVMRHLETDRDDLEEANRLLRVAVKKIKTLTAEQQEDILDKLKVRKRKNGKCGRCGKDHATEHCYSKMHIDGTTLSDNGNGNKRQNMGRPAYQQSPGYQMHFPPLVGFGGAGVPQAPMQQQAHVPAAAGAAAGFQPRDIGPGGCWNCGSHGHRRFQCPVAPRGQGAPAPAAPQQPAVPGVVSSGQLVEECCVPLSPLIK